MIQKKYIIFAILFLSTSSQSVFAGSLFFPGDDPNNRARRRKDYVDFQIKMDKPYTEQEIADFIEQYGRPPAEREPESGPFDKKLYFTLEEKEIYEAKEAGEQRAIAAIAAHKTMRDAPIGEQTKVILYDGFKAGAERFLIKKTSDIISATWKAVWKTNEQIREEKKMAALANQAKKLMFLEARMGALVKEKQMLEFIKSNSAEKPLALTPTQVRKQAAREQYLSEALKELARAIDEYQEEMAERREKASAQAA